MKTFYLVLTENVETKASDKTILDAINNADDHELYAEMVTTDEAEAKKVLAKYEDACENRGSYYLIDHAQITTAVVDLDSLYNEDDYDALKRFQGTVTGAEAQKIADMAMNNTDDLADDFNDFVNKKIIDFE